MAGKWRPVQGRDNKYFTVDMCVSKWSGLRQNMVDYEIVILPAQVLRNDACPFVRPSVRPSHFFPDNRSKDFSHFVYGYWAL